MLSDIGVNFTSSRFKKKLSVPNIITSAQEQGVQIMVGISNSIQDIKPNLEICDGFDNVFCTCGVHPHSTAKTPLESVSILEEFIVKNKKKGTIVAVGECGLDYNRDFATPLQQIPWFKVQIELAKKHKLPLYLHCRDAFADLDKIMKGSGFKGRVVVHCFTGTWDEMKSFLDSGYYIGVTGWITDTGRNHALKDALENAMKDPKYKALLMSRLMVETDSPWLYPKNLKKGKGTNIPENVKFVIEGSSEVLKMDPELLANMTYKNALTFFGLDTASETPNKTE